MGTPKNTINVLTRLTSLPQTSTHVRCGTGNERTSILFFSHCYTPIAARLHANQLRITCLQ